MMSGMKISPPVRLTRRYAQRPANRLEGQLLPPLAFDVEQIADEQNSQRRLHRIVARTRCRPESGWRGRCRPGEGLHGALERASAGGRASG